VRLRRRRDDPRIRYYLYISDAKLDMLFEQIDRGALKRISAEVKVDLKVASVTVKRADDPALTRAAKLRVVERFIDRHHHVGTIEEPGNEYFRGRMGMAWGWLGNATQVTERGIVLFQGWQDHHTVVLASSSRHVLGWDATEEEKAWGRSSFTTAILWALDEYISNTPELAELIQQEKDHYPRGWPQDRDWRKRAGAPGLSGMLNESFFGRNRAYHDVLPQTLEFLAVPLAQDGRPTWRFPPRVPFSDAKEATNSILGTPLYVAIAPTPDTTVEPRCSRCSTPNPSPAS